MGEKKRGGLFSKETQVLINSVHFLGGIAAGFIGVDRLVYADFSNLSRWGLFASAALFLACGLNVYQGMKGFFSDRSDPNLE